VNIDFIITGLLGILAGIISLLWGAATSRSRRERNEPDNQRLRVWGYFLILVGVISVIIAF